MEISVFYGLAFLALANGTAAIYMALIERFPVSWLYYHYKFRKPLSWAILAVLLVWSSIIFIRTGEYPVWSLVPIALALFGILLTYRMHQESAFRAVDFPEFTSDISILPIEDNMEVAIVECDGETRCYPLDYVIHHHIINDSFGSRLVALTYCAMCRSVIPFDVTDIGPLFVGSFKNANMILADRKTKTFFQQATFKSIIGPLHPMELQPIPFQILPWSDVKRVLPDVQVVRVTEKDFRVFQLPIPGIWKKIVSSESTPGLAAKNRDKTFPARTRVIGILPAPKMQNIVYLKEEVMDKRIVSNCENGFFLVGIGGTVNAYKCLLNQTELDISLEENGLLDTTHKTRWDIRGKYRSGPLHGDLEKVAISDEYWFSWKRFHPDSELVRL